VDGPEWLSDQLTAFTCPACRRPYRDARISLLAERDGLFFVDLDCAACGSHTVAIVTVGSDDAEGQIAEIPVIADDVPSLEPRPAGGAPVSADDVLEMHLFLAHFRGDVDALFRAGARRPGGAERR
jgi:hypothetical protein